MGHLLYDGKILKIGEVQSFGASNFKKIEFVVVEEEGQYPQEIKFEFTGDQVNALDAYKLGDIVTVAFTLRGNEYQGKHYVSLKAIAIGEKIAEDNPLRDSKSTGKVVRKQVEKPVEQKVEASEDDLPF